MVAHPSTADRSILDDDDNDGTDEIAQIDQIIESFEERLHRLRVQRSEIPRGSTTDDDNGGGVLLELDENSQMDEEINLQEERLRRLRTRRNSKILISRLPTELMAHIFTYCIPDYDVTFPDGKSYFFTHVCHSWRSIALNHAPLWTLVNDHLSLKLARTMLERSKTAMLDIRLWSRCLLKPRKQWEWEEWRELSKAIQGELPRIGHLRADMDSRDRRHIKELVYDLVQPAPSLRSIKLSNYYNWRMRLPDQFLGGRAPLLTQIHLHSVEIPWNSPLLQNLTFLKLRHGSYGTGKQMFDALRSMPQLEVLDLTGIFPRDITETDLIPLPKLHQLFLGASSEELDACTSFIKRLLFPCTTMLCIEYSAREEVDAFKGILSYLSQLFSESRIEPSVVKSPRTIRSLSLGLKDDSAMGHDTQVITFTAWNIGSIPSEMNGRIGPSSLVPPPILHLRLHQIQTRSHSRCRLSDDLKAVLGSFQTNSIETFHIHGKPGTGEISECLGPILWSSNLKTLRAYGPDCSFLLPTLLDARNGSDSRLSTETPILTFPALLDVYVDYSRLQPKFSSSLLVSLVGALESRMKHGRKLGKLIIKKYDDGLTGEQVAPLKEVVDEFDWEVEVPLPPGRGW